MRIIQMVPTLSGKDAIGNDVMSIHRALEALGYESIIFANRVAGQVDVPYRTEFDPCDFSNEDIAIYHFSVGDSMTERFAELECRKVLVYHNVTPPSFFTAFEPIDEKRCCAGLREIRTLAGRVDYCIADSEWNKQDLKSMGFCCPIEVFPILLDFDEYRSAFDPVLFDALSEKKGTKILSVGRIVPNKCQHDILRAFHCYKSHFDQDAKLYLVGSYNPKGRYYASLASYAISLGLQDVYFTGSLPFDRLVTYYRVSDVFLCQSEHEGFCVPLLESMIFDLPVVAYDACAIGETLGPGALVLDTKDPMVTAGIIRRAVNDPALRDAIIATQRRRMEDFEFNALEIRLAGLLRDIMEHE